MSHSQPPAAPKQTWDPQLYAGKHSFVYKVVGEMLELLAPKAGERIVDLGCGTGQLTAEIAVRGATVVGLDLSPEMIRAAQCEYPHIEFRVADATSFTVAEPQDAVFSNAALHWVHPPADAVRAIAGALRPGGRFVAEFGGYGCVESIVTAVRAALPELDVRRQWFFPSVGEYAPLLEAQGLEVRFATLFDRPTPLEDGERGLRNWLQMFAGAYLSQLEESRREDALATIEQHARATLWKDDQWVADYRRIRVVAVKR